MSYTTLCKDFNDDSDRDFPVKSIVVRPMNGGDTEYLIGVLQSYNRLVCGENYMRLKNALDDGIPHILVAIKRGGMPVGFSILGKYKTFPHRGETGFIYANQDENAEDIAKALIRGMVIQRLAKKGPASTHNLSIAFDLKDVAIYKALKTSEGCCMTSILCSGPTLMGERTLGLASVDNMAYKKKHIQLPEKSPAPHARPI